MDVINITLRVGESMFGYYNVKRGLSLRNDNNSLTEVHRKTNELICRKLNRLGPCCNILSEENKDIEYRVRKEWDRLWPVNHLDWTQKLIKRTNKFIVDIVLVKIISLY